MGDPQSHTPLQQPDLDLSLLDNSPPDGIGLREAIAMLNPTIKAAQDLLSLG